MPFTQIQAALADDCGGWTCTAGEAVAVLQGYCYMNVSTLLVPYCDTLSSTDVRSADAAEAATTLQSCHRWRGDGSGICFSFSPNMPHDVMCTMLSDHWRLFWYPGAVSTRKRA